MIDGIRRTIEFIAWSNFTDWRVLALWAGSLALLAAFAWTAWTAGWLVMRRWRFESAGEEMVLCTATGLALLSFALFVLGVSNLYRAWAVIPLGLFVLAAPLALRLPTRALVRPLARMGAALRERPWLWALLVVSSMPALLPPYRWDEVGYHLAYAHEWAQAGGLTVNPTVQYPLYTFNWQVLQGAALMIGGETLVHLLTWLTFVIATLAASLLARRLGAHPTLAPVAAFAFALTPLAQRYASVGFVDMPLMAFLIVPVLALLASADQPDAGAWRAVPGALGAAMFVGLKILGMVYVPLFLLLGALRFRGRALWTYAAVFCVAGSLWYARNLVLSGDPAPPLFSQLLGRPTPLWSEQDMELQAEDLNRGLSREPLALVSLPVRVLVSTESGSLRDWPLLGYSLLFPFSLLLIPTLWRRRQMEPAITAWYAVAVWVGTTYLIRYALFLPLAVALAALVLTHALGWLRVQASRTWIYAAAGVALLVGPTPASLRYFKNTLSAPIPTTDAARWTFVEMRMPEVREVRLLREVAPPPARVYSTEPQLRYYYGKFGYEMFGNTFHPGRLSDFQAAAARSSAGAFLNEFRVDYLVLPKPDESTRNVVPDSLLSALARDPALVRVESDSGATIYRASRPAVDAR